MEISAFWDQVNQEIAKYDLLKHPFYQAWSAGELTTEDLKFYAQQYFHQVSEFPAYLTTLHSRLPEGAMRRAVLANAYEEECDSTPHSQLWMRFVEGMGGTETGTNDAAAIPEMSNLVKSFRAMAAEAPVAAVFGDLFAYESQVPRIAAEKLNGLKQHYGADDRTCSYFALHRTADVHHSNVWRKIIAGLIEQNETRAEEVLQGVSQAAQALWTALDGIERDRPNHKTAGCSHAIMN
jgi:pyrroloquinoline-quinone synthase